MALNKPKLIADIKEIMEMDTNGKSNTEAALMRLADAIEAYVQSGAVQATTVDGKAVIGKLV